MKRGQGRRRGSGLSSWRDKVASDWPWEAAGEAIWGCRALFCTHRIRVPAKLLDRGVTWEVESVSGVWGLAGGWGQPLRSHQSADRWCLYAALRWMRRGYGIGGEETKPWGRCGDPQADGDVGSGSGERNQGVFPPAGRWVGFAWSRCY